MFENIRLSDLPERAVRVLRAPSSTRPAIWLLEEEGAGAVVKDFSVNQAWYRHTAGRFLVWREQKALRRLAGVPGVPRLLGVVDGVAIVMERLPGRTLENLEQERRLEPGFFDRLHEVVLQCHAKGVAHCDLKRAANILFGDDGRPYIIDWGASISASEFRFCGLKRIFERFEEDDLLAVIKVKLRHCPEQVSADEKARLHWRSAPERLIRRLRDRLREILQRVA